MIMQSVTRWKGLGHGSCALSSSGRLDVGVILPDVIHEYEAYREPRYSPG